ncbi:MAG: insulinase family protein [Spirochaetia bacterium]
MRTTLTQGDELHGFTVQNIKDLKEIHAEGILAEHKKSGCQIYHVHNDDRENLFAFAFLTAPEDSTGVAHILEHSVLCGSERYPLKDPFVVLLNSSLNTFLNAITFPDKTVYPASTTVEEDFYNIMNVYGDAVFFPNLKPEVFRQEGHRLEFDENGELKLTGVVLNEMEGNYATKENVVAEWAYRSLFPFSPYSYDSGGDPDEIPKLTYEKFLDFHKKYYHPQNCRIILYGNIPTEKHMEFLDRLFLSRFSKQDIEPMRIPTQKRFHEPVRLEKHYPAPDEDIDGKTTVMLNWLSSEITDAVKLLSMEILEEALIGHSGSPLEKALRDSELGEDLSPISGLETELKELVFSVGLRGTDPEKTGAIESLIITELERLWKDGIPRDILTAAINKIEFQNKELMSSGPFGLRIMRSVLRGWLHGAEPERTLLFNQYMEQVKKRMQDNPRYLEDLIKDELLDNPHHSVLTVVPDPKMAEERNKKKAKNIREIQNNLTDSEKAAIKKAQEELKDFQNSPDSEKDKNKIPSLKISDVPEQVETIDFTETEFRGNTKLKLNEFTNGIDYVTAAFRLDGLPQELDPYLPLYARAVFDSGLPGMGYDMVSTELSKLLGGYSFRIESTQGTENAPGEHSFAYLSYKALSENMEQASDLVFKLFKNADFTAPGRLKNIFLELRNDVRASFIHNGHSYAIMRAASVFSNSIARSEVWKGVSQLEFLNSIDPQRDKDRIFQAFSEIRKYLTNTDIVSYSVVSWEDDLHKADNIVEKQLNSFPGAGKPEMPKRNYPKMPNYQSVAIPSSVGYVASAFPSSRYGTKAHVHEHLLTHILKTGLFWEKIRMTGGAYGAFASIRGREGIGIFASYRDPRVSGTLKDFEACLQEVADTGISADELEKAVLGSVGSELKPLKPSEKGGVALKRKLYGITDTMRQNRRDWLLSVKQEDIVEAAKRMKKQQAEKQVMVITGKPILDLEEEKLPQLGKNRIGQLL